MQWARDENKVKLVYNNKEASPVSIITVQRLPLSSGEDFGSNASNDDVPKNKLYDMLKGT